ncbi:MAG: TonB-dependent receptor, partial [Tannerella sp.]|nr:TonB-dependent receptor [Tannerella sp.]
TATDNHLVIRLAEDAKALEEVVVVGYGTQIKRNVATAISSVSADKFVDIPVVNATQALVGQVSGIYLQQQTGAPGEPPIIRIRGNGSITSSNSPLYVIDGYPTNDGTLFNALAPNDIESIDVLKDAASAAIYGSRAGNGVIIVTTRRGKQDKVAFNVDATVGFEQIMQKYPMMDAGQYVEMAKEGWTYNPPMINGVPRPVPDLLNQPERWTVTDWQDVIFRTAPFHNYQVSAVGGSEKIQFAISGGVIDQKGILVNTFMNRYNFKAAIDAQLLPKLRVGITVQPSYTVRRIQQTSGGNTSNDVNGILSEALAQPPILPVWRDNGDYNVIFQDPEQISIFNDQVSNPLNKLDAAKDYFYTFRQTGSSYLEFTPVKNLKLRSSLSMGLVADKEEFYVEAFMAKGNGNTGNISTPNLAQIKARRKNTTNINLYWSNTITYDFAIRDDHQFTALLGYDFANQNDFYVQLEPRTDADNPVAFDNTVIKNVQGAVLNKGNSESRKYVFDAIFARLNYSYKGKYILTTSIRRDRSSRFGPNNRAGIFPSIALAWNILDEAWMQNIPLLSALKLRVSYGETGNDQLDGYYPWLTTMTREYYNFGTTDARVIGYKPGGFSNEDLGWEKNRQYDLGLEVGLFRNRLSLMFDLYKRNSNTILSRSLPTINGKASSVMENVGNVENKGFELTVNSTNISTRDFAWKTDFNISANRNKIVDLGGAPALSTTGVIRNYVGRPMGDFYMYVLDGTFNNQSDVDNLPKLGTQGIGDLRFKDISGPDGVPDGVINANDQVRVGNYQPDFVFGLGNTLMYKWFDLSILLDAATGFQIYNSFELALGLSRWLENSSAGALDRWRSEEDPGSGRYHRAGTKNLSSDISASTRYLWDGDFLRIRNITLGATLPAQLSKRIGVQKARLFVTGQNLKTFLNYPGFGNPQASTNNASGTTNGSTSGNSATSNGQDAGAYPLAKNISVGINITF